MRSARRRGTLDCPPIDKAVYLTLHPYFDRGKTFLRYSRSELVTDLGAIEHPLFRVALQSIGPTSGVEIIYTDGSDLGDE